VEALVAPQGRELVQGQRRRERGHVAHRPKVRGAGRAVWDLFAVAEQLQAFAGHVDVRQHGVGSSWPRSVAANQSAAARGVAGPQARAAAFQSARDAGRRRAVMPASATG